MTEPKERGITFNPWCVRALLSGAKTGTMRVMKPQPPDDADEVYYGTASQVAYVVRDSDEYDDWMIRAPFGPVGTVFYIRETYRRIFNRYHMGDAFVTVEYQADGSKREIPFGDGVPPKPSKLLASGKMRWTTGRYMPQWAARPQRWRIGAITPMRVQDTTEEIAKTEGAFGVPEDDKQMAARRGISEGKESVGPLDYFREAWDEIHPGGWDENKWVWRYHDFEEVTR